MRADICDCPRVAHVHGTRTTYIVHRRRYAARTTPRGRSVDQVRAHRRDGNLPAINTSRGRGRPTWRWRPSTIDTFLRTRKDLP